MAFERWRGPVIRDVVVLGEDDLEQSWQLGPLALGVGPQDGPPTWPVAGQHHGPWSGAADTAAVRRAGLLDGRLPGLDAAVAGAAVDLLDDF